jgi:hypothetical protein
VVLKSLQVARRFIARTTTAQGLRAIEEVARRTYKKGVKATRRFLDHNPNQYSDFLPQLN